MINRLLNNRLTQTPASSNTLLFSILTVAVLVLTTSCGLNDYDEYYPTTYYVDEVHVLEVASGDVHLIDNGDYPIFNLDGTQIIYYTDGPGSWNEIYVANLDDGAKERMLDPIEIRGALRHSPVASEILFSALDYNNRSWDIFLYNYADQRLVNLTGSADEGEYDPSFSADGQVVVYTVRESIRTISVLGEENIIYENAVEELYKPHFAGQDSQIVFIQNGLTANDPECVYLINRYNPEEPVFLDGVTENYTIRSSTELVYEYREQLYLYNTVDSTTTALGEGCSPAVTLDGSKIVSLREAGSDSGYHIQWTEPDGSNLESLALVAYDCCSWGASCHFRVSPQNSYISFVQRYSFEE